MRDFSVFYTLLTAELLTAELLTAKLIPNSG
jgi:hypothetical protein